MSPLRSRAGPAVCTNGTSSSAATICASEVLPSPGGPASSRWSSASARAPAASIATASCSRSARSSSSSPTRYGVWMRVAVSPACLPAPSRVGPTGCAPEGVLIVLTPSRRRPRQTQRLGDQLLGAQLLRAVALHACQQLLGLAGRIAELDQALAGERARIEFPPTQAATRNDRHPWHDRRLAIDADLLAQLDDDPLGRALADDGHRLKTRRVASGERAEQLLNRPSGEHRKGDLGADSLNREQHQEQLAL